MALKFIVKAPLPLEPDESLMKILHKTIPMFEERRPKTNVHASDVVDSKLKFCAREYALYLLAPETKQKSDFICTALKLTFDFGNDTQRRLNEEYLVDRAYGDWKCRVCGEEKKFCKKPTVPCKYAKEGIICNWGYEEIRVTSNDSGITGGIDLLVDMGVKGSKLKVVEVKTLAKEQFEKLQVALPEHRLRTNLYLRLIEESSHPHKKKIDTESSIILYIIKGYGQKSAKVQSWKLHDSATSPYKEFVVQRNDAHTDNLSLEAKQYKDFVEGNAPIPSQICTNQKCERAKECAIATLCFSGKYPKLFKLTKEVK